MTFNTITICDSSVTLTACLAMVDWLARSAGRDLSPAEVRVTLSASQCPAHCLHWTMCTSLTVVFALAVDMLKGNSRSKVGKRQTMVGRMRGRLTMLGEMIEDYELKNDDYKKNPKQWEWNNDTNRAPPRHFSGARIALHGPAVHLTPSAETGYGGGSRELKERLQHLTDQR
jgi:hypothetical protein